MKRRVVSRTVVVAALMTFIVTGYLAMVSGLDAVVGSSGSSLPLSLLSTAVVAVAFQPVRRRVQRLADRMLYGRRTAPYEVLAAFCRRLGEAVGMDTLLADVTRSLVDGTGAVQAAVWLVDGSHLTQAAVWPAQATPAPAIALNAGLLPDLGDATVWVAVAHEGQMLGALAVTKPGGVSLARAERALVDDMATQAGVALRNVRLIAELSASRQRIVSAQDSQRRRLERDIHDGAQQRLVALSLALRVAQARAASHPVLADALADVAAHLDEGMANLRELAHGIYPSILSNEGLGPALESLAERAAIATTVASSVDGRLPAPVEGTAYQVAAHGLTAAILAGASTATIGVAEVSGELVIEVSSDAQAGAALAGPIRDRVIALDGRIEVTESALRAVIPYAA